jgi:hypothetical protein
VPFLGLLFFANTSVLGCQIKTPQKTLRRVNQVFSAPVKPIEVTPPTQSLPCAVNEPRAFWQHFKCGEPPAYSALGTLIAAFFAAMIGVIALRINANTVRGQRVHEQIRMVLEIDKEMISCPQLWGIFGEVVPPAERADPAILWKQKAVVFSYFNMFDFVYGFYARRIWMWLWPWPFNRDKQDWKAWKAYMRNFFQTSPYSCDVWDAYKGTGMYPAPFTRFIDNKMRPRSLAVAPSDPHRNQTQTNHS